jgi:hypothetical protein
MRLVVVEGAEKPRKYDIFPEVDGALWNKRCSHFIKIVDPEEGTHECHR